MDTSRQAKQARSSVDWSAWLKGYVLFMIVVAGVFNAIDRQLVSILLQSIKADLHASDTEMGLLTGLYFAFFYAVIGIPLARLADIGNRRSIIAVCVALWSGATMACGLAQNYAQLAIGRMLVAVGEGGSGPSGTTMLADIYPVHTRTRVFGLYSTSSAIGLALSLFLGGMLSQWMSWRTVFLVVGAPGLLFALLFFLTVPEPGRKGVVGPRPSVLRAIVGFWKIPAYRWTMVVTFGGAATGFATLSWFPAFLIRTQGMTKAQVGLQVGLSLFFGLFAGNVGSGFIADHLAKRNPQWIRWITGIALLICAPFILLMALSNSALTAIVAFGFFNVFAAFMPPCTQSIVLGVVDPRSRALASSSVPLFLSIGAAAGPFGVGLITDLLAAGHGVGAIRISLAAASVWTVLGGLACFMGARSLPKDYHGKE